MTLTDRKGNTGVLVIQKSFAKSPQDRRHPDCSGENPPKRRNRLNLFWVGYLPAVNSAGKEQMLDAPQASHVKPLREAEKKFYK